MSRTTLAHLALFAVALIYGANFAIAKVVMDGDYIAPRGFILMRVVTATSLFWLVALGRRRQRPEKKDLARLALCGFLGVAANQTLFFTGLDRTTPIHAALIMVLTPVLVLLLAALLERRNIRWHRGLGVVLAGCGAFLLISGGQGSAIGQGDVLGDILVGLNATAYALYLILVRPLMTKYPPMQVLRWVFLFGLGFVALIGVPEALAARWSDFTVPVTLSFLYVLIFTTYFTYTFNAFALRQVPPVVVSAYIYLQPVIAAVIGILLGMDQVTMIQLVAAALIFPGVWLVSRERFPRFSR